MVKEKHKRQRRVIGSILKINLNDGSYAFGRVLPEPLIAFYDFNTSSIPSSEKILNKPVLFIVPVYDYAITKGIWEIIGHKELEVELQKEPLFFKYDDCTGKLFLYKDSTQEEIPTTWENCKELECAAVWEPGHIEERLEDHFMGRSNYWVEALKPPFIQKQAIMASKKD